MAAPHQPPYVYTPNQGYENTEPVPTSLAPPNNEQGYDDEDEYLDDVFDDEEDVDEEYLDPNASDLTKTYNRQRQLNSSAEGPAGTNTQPRRPAVNTQASVDDQMSALARHAGKIRLDDAGARYGGDRDRDKSDRATTELVLDKRTRMILLQMINRGVVSEVHGVISTGKEANVYGAVLRPEGTGAVVQRAIKVYKTSILVFKDRERYVTGDHRFKGGAAKGNNRKMVKQWAEKEFRNLRRLHAAGIACPEPIKLKLHVLVMEFLGDRKGWAYPRLRDAPIAGDDADELWRALYLQLLGIMRRLYRVCRLVHADLSEYNILYNDKKLYIIDMSQSVEHDHPRSLEFLRMDIKNVGDYFRRQGVDTLSDRTVFNFVMAPGEPVEEPAMTQAIEHLYQIRPTAADDDAGAAESEIDNQVFRHQYIPQTLSQVYDIEQDGRKLALGEGDELVYKSLLADQVVAPKTEAKADVKPEEDTDEEMDTTDDEEAGAPLDDADLDDSSVDESLFEKGRPRGRKFEDKDEKREHKAAVKEAKREKRKEKIPKSVKKRLMATSSSKKK